MKKILIPFIAALLLSQVSEASIGAVTKADLSGPWQITLVGFTGRGQTSMLVNTTLNTAGTGTATIKQHSSVGDFNITGQTFTIKTLDTNGTGTASLSCGLGCGWEFNIQVSPDRSIFNIVDVAPVNPGNFVEGMAIHQ